MTAVRRLAAVPTAQRRAIAYVRVSDEAGRGVDLLSPAIQLRAIEDYCAREGIVVVEVVEDIDRTGRSWAKRKIEASVRKIEAGSADLIVVWKWSRVARNVKDWAVAVARVADVGGQLLSATEPFDDTAAGRFGRGVLAQLAEMESDLIGEGWSSTHRNRFERGLPPHGTVPWCMTSAKHTVEIDPERADAVRTLYRMYIDGAGSSTLASWLADHGHRGSNGAPWWPANVLRMLDNELHAGVVTYHGERRPTSFPAVIDAETYAAYRARRRANARSGPSRAVTGYLLSGLARCGVCGRPLAGQPGTNGRGDRLRCQTASRQHTHESVSTRAADVDAVVLAWLADAATGLFDTVVELEPEPVVADRATVLEGKLAELDRKLTRLTDLLVSEVVSEDEYRSARARNETARAELVAELETAVDREALKPHEPLRDAAADLIARWPIMLVDERRAILRRLIDAVVVNVRPFAVEVRPL